MLDNKKLKEIETKVKIFIREGTIIAKNPPLNTAFFLGNAENSLQSARLLFDVSSKKELQEVTGYLKFNGYLWAINASYYSIFIWYERY
ncbi:MAG: hypothetical protein ACMXYE_03210 [Candidatus Woesearchaeota archaeon]